MHKSAELSRQCAHVEGEKEANLTVGTEENSKQSQWYNTEVQMYKCIIRPQLEYYIQVVIARNRT